MNLTDKIKKIQKDIEIEKEYRKGIVKRLPNNIRRSLSKETYWNIKNFQETGVIYENGPKIPKKCLEIMDNAKDRIYRRGEYDKRSTYIEFNNIEVETLLSAIKRK
jgi:hypothetical protein